MAEFCYECLEDELGINFSNKKVVLSKYLALCEGCKKYKHVVLSIREENLFEKLLSKFGF